MAKGELFQGLPAWSKGVIAVSAVAGIGIIGFFIYTKLKKIGDKGKDDTARETEKLAGQDYEELVKQGQKLSFAPSSYAAAAETIVKMLDGCEMLDSEFQAMAEVIKVVKKPIDWYYLIKIFGQKDIADCGTFGFYKTRYSLVGLLSDQLDTTVLVTPFPKTVIGGYAVPMGYYGDSKDVLTKYLATVGVTF